MGLKHGEVIQESVTVPRRSANGAACLYRGKTLRPEKWWYRITQLGPGKIVGRCYVLLVRNLKLESWAVNIRGEVGKLELGKHLTEYAGNGRKHNTPSY